MGSPALIRVQKLLVENAKLIGFQDFLRAPPTGKQSTPGLDRVDHEALLDKSGP